MDMAGSRGTQKTNLNNLTILVRAHPSFLCLVLIMPDF